MTCKDTDRLVVPTQAAHVAVKVTVVGAVTAWVFTMTLPAETSFWNVMLGASDAAWGLLEARLTTTGSGQGWLMPMESI